MEGGSNSNVSKVRVVLAFLGMIVLCELIIMQQQNTVFDR